MNDDTLLVSGVNIYVLGVDYLPTKSDLSLKSSLYWQYGTLQAAAPAEKDLQ